MFARKSIDRSLAARLCRLRGCFAAVAVNAITALTAFGIGCQVAGTSAATCAAALTLGGLLLLRASNEPSKSLVALKRVRARPCDMADRNHH